MLHRVGIEIEHVTEKGIRPHRFKGVLRKFNYWEILEIRRDDDIRSGCCSRGHNMTVILIGEVHS